MMKIFHTPSLTKIVFIDNAKLKRKLREETEKRVEATKQLDRVRKELEETKHSKRDEMLMSRMKKLEQQIDTITESTRGDPAARLRAGERGDAAVCAAAD